MKNIKWSTALLGFVIVVICYAVTFGASNKQVNKYHGDRSIVLENGWTVDFNGNIIENYSFGSQRLPLTYKGDRLVMTTVIPSELPINPVLSVKTVHSDIAVYIDETEIYSYGQEQYDTGHYVSGGRQFIDLKEDYAGKTLKMILRVSENRAFASLPSPYISNSNYLHRDFIMKHQLEILCILFLIVSGVLGMALAVLKSGDNKDFRPLLGIASFSLAVGLWSLCTTDLMGYFTYSIWWKNVIEYASLYATPFCAFSYFGFDVSKENRHRVIIYKIIHFSSGIFFVGSCLLHAFRIMYFPSFLIICHILIVIIIGYIVGVNIYDSMHGKQISKTLFVGLMCLVVFVSFDLINYNLRKYSSISSNDYYTSVIYLGVMCFIIALIYDFLDKILKNAFKRVELETLEKMAYNDMLTGISNRRKSDEILEKIISERLPYEIICFDLNNLKVVNDTQGHAQGDEYIRSFARILEVVFDDKTVKEAAGNTSIARIGGDEFIVILYGKVIDREYIEKQIDVMNNLINDVNRSHENWNMSTAYGIAISTEADYANPKQAIKQADERLYDKKSEMKREANDISLF